MDCLQFRNAEAQILIRSKIHAAYKPFHTSTHRHTHSTKDLVVWSACKYFFSPNM